MTITSQMVAGDLTFSVSDLDFSYNASANEYEIATGALSFDTSEGFSFSTNSASSILPTRQPSCRAW